MNNDIVFQHRRIVFVTETSSKMASIPSQKWLTIFCQEAQILCISYPWDFLPFKFAQISPTGGANTYQTMYGETLDFQCQRQ